MLSCKKHRKMLACSNNISSRFTPIAVYFVKTSASIQVGLPYILQAMGDVIGESTRKRVKNAQCKSNARQDE